jgi:hypothetical protein
LEFVLSKAFFSLLLEAKKEQLKEIKHEKETTQTTSTLKSTSTKNEALPLKLFGLIFVGEFIYII